MNGRFKRNLVVGAIVAAACAFAGGAYAATQSSTNPRQAFLNDVAKRLGVSPKQLNSAMLGAFLDQLNTAVKDGRLTQAQANALKQRAEQTGVPPLGGGFGRHFGFGLRGPVVPGQPGGPGAPGGPGMPGRPGGPLGAAATYLGLTPTQLFQQLSSGKSLAQIASAQHKSVSGLKQAMLSALRARLDKAVTAKLITSGQEQQILSRLSARLDQLINRTPRPGGRWGYGAGSEPGNGAGRDPGNGAGRGPGYGAGPGFAPGPRGQTFQGPPQPGGPGATGAPALPLAPSGSAAPAPSY